MPQSDRLELGLTLALPWLVFLFLASVQACVLTPRPSASSAHRLVAVGRPAAQRAPVVATDSAHEIDQLDQPALFDLQLSDARWLRLLNGGRVRRADISFGLAALQAQVERQGVGAAEAELDVRVSFPVPEQAGQRHLLVALRPWRLLPPATWEVYVYRITNGAPQPLLALREQRDLIRIARAPDGRLALGHDSLWRDNLHYVWNGSAYAAEPLRGRAGQVAWLFAGAFAALPWWGWLLVVWPGFGLQWGCAAALQRIRAAGQAGSTTRVEAIGLAIALAGLALAVAVVVTLRRYPTWDLVSGLLAPVLVGLALCCGLQWAAAAAERLGTVDPREPRC